MKKRQRKTALSLAQHGAWVTGELTKDHHSDIVSILGPTPTKAPLSLPQVSVLTNARRRKPGCWGPLPL